MNTKYISFFALILLSIQSQAQIKLKNSTNLSNNTLINNDLKLKESVIVLVHFPKSLFTIDQINTILDSNSHLLEISAQSILQKPNCTENLITNTRSLSACWVKNTSKNAISLVATNYSLVNSSNTDYYTLQATINYNGLAPKTALVSAFVNKQYLQNLQAGNWSIMDKTTCTFSISESRWEEFVFQAGGVGVRGFAVRGYAGNNSICTAVPKNYTVEFWVSKNIN